MIKLVTIYSVVCEKSNSIGNFIMDSIKGVATKEQISEFFAKVRKTQKIINY